MSHQLIFTDPINNLSLILQWVTMLMKLNRVPKRKEFCAICNLLAMLPDVLSTNIELLQIVTS